MIETRMIQYYSQRISLVGRFSNLILKFEIQKTKNKENGTYFSRMNNLYRGLYNWNCLYCLVYTSLICARYRFINGYFVLSLYFCCCINTSNENDMRVDHFFTSKKLSKPEVVT